MDDRYDPIHGKQLRHDIANGPPADDPETRLADLIKACHELGMDDVVLKVAAAVLRANAEKS